MRLQPATRAEEPVKREPDPREKPLPIWRNTRPRGNPETDLQDLARSHARMEALLGG